MRRLLALLLGLLPAVAPAQESAVLVADSLLVTQDERLVAEGNVQAFYEGTTLSAARITYDRASEHLTIEGPIFLRDGETGAILTAERAELDPRLEDGLLQGARLVLDRQLQLAANRIDRVGGNVSALTGVAASSCQVCPGRAPLWEIRARQVVHDEAAEQLWFENATFRIRGVPIFWIPRMRLPDPGNERATGLLIPRLRSTDQLGIGVKLPVFFELGPSRDLTLTPYLSPETGTIEARYRQAFLSGEIEVTGAASRDSLDEADPRGFVAAEGAFALGDDLDLLFDLQAVGDDAYLLDYGYSDADRLQSTFRLARVGQSSLFLGDLTFFQSLRDDEPEESLPPVLSSLSWEKRAGALGGILGWGAEIEGYARTRSGEGDEARDVLRAGASADWRRDWVLGAGLLLEAEGRAALDGFRVTDDPAYPDPLLRAAPAAALTMRWPLVRRGHSGTSDLVEPVVSLGWSEAYGDAPPDEDSRLVEFDTANLYALTRLPGEDEVEEGGRLSFGLAWTRTGEGFASTLAVGRVLRSGESDASDAAGLDGRASDTLLAGRIDLEGGFSLNARTLIDGSLAGPEIGKTEARVDWANALLTLSSAYVYLPADLAEDRDRSAAEITLDAEIRPSDRWVIEAGGRYDLGNDTPARARLGVGWRNECVEVDLSVSRRYTSSESVEPSTDFGLSVNLKGFSAGRQAPVAPGACRG